MAYLRGTPRMLPDQPVPTVDPEVERLAHVMVDGLIARLAAEPVVPAWRLPLAIAGVLLFAALLGWYSFASFQARPASDVPYVVVVPFDVSGDAPAQRRAAHSRVGVGCLVASDPSAGRIAASSEGTTSRRQLARLC